ncbi:MAG: hypothetical protein AAF601_01690 [Pseudomonadota bacterium]
MTKMINLPFACPYCQNLIDEKSVAQEEPGFQLLAPEATVLQIAYAEGIGNAIARLLWEQKWPRRKVLNRLHHRVDIKIDQGLQLLTSDFNIIDFHDEYLHETMPKEPTDKWLLDFALQCERGLSKAPAKRLYTRLARFDLALRSAGLKAL